MSRIAVAIFSVVGVIALVVIVIAVSLVPLPVFEPLPAGTMTGSLAFVDEDNCLNVADLDHATVGDLRCEPEQTWIDVITWTTRGLEITTHGNQPITRVIDPLTGEVLETRTGADIAEPPVDLIGLSVDRPDEGAITIYDEIGRVLLSLEGPDQYWIDSAIPHSGLVAITDSQGRLAVFDRDLLDPYLVAEKVRTWPYPVWEP